MKKCSKVREIILKQRKIYAIVTKFTKLSKKGAKFAKTHKNIERNNKIIKWNLKNGVEFEKLLKSIEKSLKGEENRKCRKKLLKLEQKQQF